MNRRDHRIILITAVVGIITLVLLPIVQNEITEVVNIRGDALWILAVTLVLLVILAEIVASRYLTRVDKVKSGGKGVLVDNECGREPIRLDNERYYLSATLGSYFASLLESEETYTFVEGQIEYLTDSVSTESNQFQEIVSSLIDRKGVQILVIAADGGMGKSTLAARIVRCLYSSQEVDRILGDSAKTETIDLRTGRRVGTEPGFTDRETLYQKLAIQIGLTDQLAAMGGTVDFLRDALSPYKAIIILDNLETVDDARNVVESLYPLVGKSLRLIITTREIPTDINHSRVMIVRLKPLTKVDDMRDFIKWHIQYYQARIPDLKNIQDGLSRRNITLLIEKSGGVPLIAQLLLSDVASKSWKILDEVPALVPQQALEYLYQKRWVDLQSADQVIQLAKQVIEFVVARQKLRQRVDMSVLSSRFDGAPNLRDAIGYLQDRFLLINRNTHTGEFVVFPSLVSYLESTSDMSFGREN